MSSWKVPNTLICDTSLSFSARVVGAVLYGHINAFGCCCKSYAEIGRLAGCSAATARGAVLALEQAGYLTSATPMRWIRQQARVGYGKRCYTLRLAGSYTRIPRTALPELQQVSPATAVVVLYLFYQAGQKRRAFPSITRISQGLGMVRSTVCLALAAIRSLRCLMVELCRKANGALAANSYHMVHILSLPSCSHLPEPAVSAGILRRMLRRCLDALPAWRVVRFLANKVKT